MYHWGVLYVNFENVIFALPQNYIQSNEVVFTNLKVGSFRTGKREELIIKNPDFAHR